MQQRIAAGLFATLGFVSVALAQASSPDPYDVVWETPSVDTDGTMPLGNGDIALNAWVDPAGALWFYIAKTDAWSENGQLLKVGRLRVTLDPPPAVQPFQQALRLREGAMVTVMGEGEQAVELRLWVDANAPVVHVEVDSASDRRATASIELWRTEPRALPGAETSDLLEDRSKPNRLHTEVIVQPDTVLERVDDGIGWYHHNATSVGPALIAELQGLSGYFVDRSDPLLGRTFGALVTADGGERLDATHLRTPAGRTHHFRVHVLTEHPSTPEDWLRSVRRMATERRPASVRAEHERWWREFWERSWIHASSTTEPDLVPVNAHLVRIGVDQHGGNKFAGDLGRVTILPRALADERIAALAQVAHDRPAPALGGALHEGSTGFPAALDGSAAWSFRGGLTIEAWIRPGDLPAGGGRIVDKVTPGGSDGFLFDTWPGHSLRFIVGREILSQQGALTRGRWTHVAAVVDSTGGCLAMFVDGEMVASQPLEAGDDAFVVSRAYALQRYVDACAGRGRYPIKFNGSLFTVPFPGKFGDADYRRWGPGYWWQNTRLPYISMCAAGDFDLMRPLFRMYADELMPLHRYRTRQYTGHDGAFIPECIYFWGPIFTATYGWTPFVERGEDKLQQSGYHKWEWVSGPELVWMMLDYYEHTLDEAFLNESVLPTAHQILTFFDQHYETGVDGKLVMHPSQALETWWDTTDPMPEVAGLRAVTARLMALPERLASKGEREFWTSFAAKLPELPTWEKDGVVRLAPAGRFESKRNVENPELYAVFPFRLVSFEKPNAQLGVEALRHRWDRGNSGWRQDDLFMAYLGLADDARASLVGRARNKHVGSRFPVFWGPNYDWIPDQDHGGVLTRALQAMLMQTEGEKIFLLPAWPSDWDVDFKLHAPYRTTVSGKVRDGRVIDLRVEPEARRADVVVCEATPARGVPTPEQRRWHEMELEMFVAIDPCTWQGREYDDHSTPLSEIDPSELDTDQWCRVAKSFGAKQILFVAKHTGGFCWWQTDTTDYSIKNTPYRDGEGDVLAELSESCRVHGLRLAVYIYPGDDQWGAGIGSGGRTSDPAKQAAYDAVLRQQWTEVLTRYGEISEIWFDGSCVVDLGDVIRRHAPRAMVFQGPHATLRWVGNERGVAPDPTWQTVKSVDARSGVATDRHSDPDGDVWLPMEVDTTLLDHKWFWAPGTDSKLKSVEHLMGLYYQSVGRGCVLLLNSTPDTTGRIPASHVVRYAEFGEAIRRIYADRKGETHGTGRTIELRFEHPVTIDHVVTMEDLRGGQVVREYEVAGKIGDEWRVLVTGRSIGHKRIDVIEPVEVEALRLRIVEAVATPTIASFAAYHTGTAHVAVADRGSADRSWTAVHGWRSDRLTERWQVIDVDLTAQVSRPGQYEVRLVQTGGGGRVDVRRAVVVVAGTEAPRLITAADVPLSWTITRTDQVTADARGQTTLRLELRRSAAAAWQGELQIRAAGGEERR